MRVTRRNEIRVAIYPRVRATGEWNPSLQGAHAATHETEKRFAAAAEDLKAQILRHVDGDFDASVVWDSVPTCSFCGYEFHLSEKVADFPECCDEAQREFMNANPAEYEIPGFEGTQDALSALTIRTDGAVAS